MGAEGFILKINKELVTNLQNADKAIESLDKHTTEAYEHMKSAFDKINGLNLDKFIATINSAKEKLSGLGDVNIKINATGLDSISNMSKEAMDSVIKLSQSLSTVSTANISSGKVASSSNLFDLSGLEQQRKNFQSAIAELERQISTLHPKLQNLLKEKYNIEIPIKTIGAEDINRLQAHIENIKAKLAEVGNASGRDMKQSVQPYIEALHQLEAEIEKVKKSQEETIPQAKAEFNPAIQNILKQYDDLYAKIRDIMSEDAKLAQEMANKQKVNDAIQAQVQKIADLKQQLKDAEIEFERLKATGGAYKSDGTLTQKAKDIIAYQNQIKEEIKLQEMSASQAEKYAQSKINAAKKETDAKIAEYDKLLKKIKEYEAQKLQAESIKSSTTDVSIIAKADQSIRDSERLIQESNARKLELERQLGGELIAVQQKYLGQELTEYQKNTTAKIAEYDKLLAKIREIEQQKSFASELSATTQDSETKTKADTSVKESEKQLQELNKRKLELENELQDKLANVRQKYRNRELQEAIRAVEIEQEKKRRTYDGAMDYSKNAKNILEERQAIKYLEAAREKLDKTDANYSRQLSELNNRILEHRRNINSAIEGSKELQKSHRNLMDISGQLARKLALVFSVSQIQGYIQKLVEVRGEFELNQRALQAMLQNKQMADEIWNKTVELAVQSPFRVKELVSYTKQLAAYRIEADKLYETNKMLADISAGLGVDMRRLILAFGQVRSAAYLRGTEVRQFTEAGIPILEQLSKYLTELEGEAVTVGEVFERISKRMITFADVEEIFKRMTSEGGTFYRMQEIQAETLKGQISNLKDSFDVMFNAIGKANEGTIKNFINSIRFLTEHWEMFVPVLKAAVAMIAAMGVKALVTNKRLIALAFSLDVITNSATKQLKVTQVLATSWKALTKSIGSSIKGLASFAKANPWLVAITAVLGVLTKIVSVHREHEEAINKIAEEYDNLRKSVESVSVGFTIATDNTDFNEQKKKLQQLISTAEKDFNIKIGIDWSEITPENIVSKFEEIRQQLLNLNAFSMQFATKMQESTEWHIGDDIYKDLEQLGTVSTKTFNSMVNDANRVAFALQEAKKGGVELTKEQEKALEKLTEPQGIDESSLTYSERLRDAMSLMLVDYNKLLLETNQLMKMPNKKAYLESKKRLEEARISLERFGIVVPKIKEEFGSLDDAIDEAKKEFDKFADTIDIQANLPDKEKTLMLKTAIDAQASEKGWNSFVRDYVYRWTEEKFGVQFEVDTKKAENKLKEWQKTYISLFKSYKGFFNITSEQTKQTEIIDRLNAQLKETKDLINKINEAGGVKATQKSGAYEGMDLNKLNQEYEQIKEQLEWFGAFEEKDDKKKNASLDILNKRISLLKEVRKEYLKLAESYDKVTAKEKIVASYADAFDEAFKGTGINLTKIVSQIKPDAENAGEEIGSALTDEVKAKMEELSKSGTYIRNFSDDFVEQIKKREGFRAKPYWDKAGEKWTQGYGETKGITEKSPEMTQEVAETRLRNRLTNDFAKEINDILDKHKELVFTQEQYNQLLDVAYQGGSGKIEGLIKQASDVEVGVKHIQNIYDKVKEYVGEDAAERFGESFIQKFREAETIYDRMALLLQTTNLLVTKVDEETKTKYTAIDKDWYAGMQTRSDTRSTMFSGDLDIAKAIEQTLIRISAMDFTSVEGMVDAFEQLRPLAEKQGQEAVATLERAISGFKAEINLEIKQEANKKLKDDIESMFDRYELTLEFDKLQLPKEIANKFIGGDMLNLDELKESVIKTFAEAGGESSEELSTELNKGLREIDWLKVKDLSSGEVMKEIKSALEKIDDLENKAAKERMKTYSKYLLEGMNDRVKLRIETLKKIKEIEESKEFKPEQKERIIGAIKEESKKEEQKMDWEDFKNTDMYSMMFEDIEYLGTKALETLKGKLDEFKSSLSDLPASDVKEIMSQIEKIEDVVIKRNPFAALRETNKDIKSLKEQGKTEDVLQQDYIESSAKIDEYQKELDIVNTIISAKEKALVIENEISDAQNTLNKYSEDYSDLTAMSVDELNNRKEVLSSQTNILSGDGGGSISIEQSQEELDIINEIIDAKERIANSNQEISDSQNTLNEYAATHSQYTSMDVSELNNVQSVLNKNLKTEKKSLQNAEKGLRTYKKSRKEYADAAGEIEQIGSNVDKAFSSIRDILESVGVESDSVAGVLLDAGQNMTSLIFSAITMTLQFHAMGVAANSAMGIIGWIALALQAIATLLKAIFSAKDKALEKQIDEQKRKIEALQKAYDKLKEKVDDAYSIKDLQKYNEEMKKNLELQIEAQKIAIAAQEQRKGAQREGSKAWEELQDMQEELDEMMEKQVERWEDVFSKATDGILDDVSSAARDFTDAWWDAFQETGDGLSGLKENFKEMISNMIKQQAAMTITSAFVEKWKKDLGKYLNEKDLELTTDEAKSWMDEVRATLPQLSENLQSVWGEMADLLKETTDGGELSELSKGISSASEESIEILTAYANSIRFINQDSNEKLGMLLDNFANGNQISNDMLAELRTQTRWMRDIYNLINGLTTSYSGGGSGIKVVM